MGENCVPPDVRFSFGVVLDFFRSEDYLRSTYLFRSRYMRGYFIKYLICQKLFLVMIK